MKVQAEVGHTAQSRVEKVKKETRMKVKEDGEGRVGGGGVDVSSGNRDFKKSTKTIWKISFLL